MVSFLWASRFYAALIIQFPRLLDIFKIFQHFKAIISSKMVKYNSQAQIQRMTFNKISTNNNLVMLMLPLMLSLTLWLYLFFILFGFLFDLALCPNNLIHALSHPAFIKGSLRASISVSMAARIHVGFQITIFAKLFLWVTQ